MQMPITDDIARTLRQLAKVRDLRNTHTLHSLIIESGAESSPSLRGSLIHAYMKCGCIESSCSVFGNGGEEDRDVFLWTCLITGYVQHGYGLQAISLCKQMQVEGILLNNFTFSAVLKACSILPSLNTGKQMHSSIIESGYRSDVTIGNVLIDMYTKSGSIEYALVVFKEMHGKDVVSWSVMISGCILNQDWEKTIVLFDDMHQEEIDPNNYTYVSILKAYGSLNVLEGIRKVHSEVLEKVWDSDVFVISALVDAYIKCGNLRDGQEVFNGMSEQDLVSSNVMIDGYAQNALCSEASTLFMVMQHRGLFPDKITFASMLKACASISSFHRGKQLHAQILESRVKCDLFMGSTLIDMYVKCKRIDDAQKVFDAMLVRDVVMWNCLLTGYAQEVYGREAISQFIQMLHEGIGADVVTYVIILKACMEITSLEWGKQVHAQLVKRKNLESNLIIRSSLVDMYAKCGNIMNAREVFDRTAERDVVSWNSIISAYAQRGLNKEVYRLFELMQKEGLNPTEVTLGCVLSACRHGGLVDDGCKYLETLSLTYAIEPTTEHFGCIIDLFARVGRLDEATDFLSKLSFKPRVEPWIALLGACKTHGNVCVGERAFERIEHLVPGHMGATVLLSNLYADAKRWDAVTSMRYKLQDGMVAVG